MNENNDQQYQWFCKHRKEFTDVIAENRRLTNENRELRAYKEAWNLDHRFDNFKFITEVRA